MIGLKIIRRYIPFAEGGIALSVFLNLILSSYLILLFNIQFNGSVNVIRDILAVLLPLFHTFG